MRRIPGTGHLERQGKKDFLEKGEDRCCDSPDKQEEEREVTAGCGDSEMFSNLDGHSFGRVGTSIGRRGKRLTRLGLAENERQRAAESQQRQLFPEVLQQNKAEK